MLAQPPCSRTARLPAFPHFARTLRAVKLWSLDDQAYVDTLFGHQSEVLGIDAGRAERAVTAGADRTCRLWKIPEESQLIFRWVLQRCLGGRLQAPGGGELSTPHLQQERRTRGVCLRPGR